MLVLTHWLIDIVLLEKKIVRTQLKIRNVQSGSDMKRIGSSSVIAYFRSYDNAEFGSRDRVGYWMKSVFELEWRHGEHLDKDEFEVEVCVLCSLIVEITCLCRPVVNALGRHVQ